MIRMFINREEEMAFLERKVRAPGFQFIVLYGRRRVGKTELIRELGRRVPLLYFLADKRGTEVNARLMAREAAAFFQDTEPVVAGFEDVFRYIRQRAGSRRLAVAVDEFSYLVERDESAPSVFQRVADQVLAGSRVLLILCGSSMEMMERGVLSAKSPLYGRRTGEWKVEPLRYRDAVRFFPGYPFEGRLRAAMILGGVPAYLVQMDPGVPLEENVRRRIMAKGEPLYTEVGMILQEELRDPSTYLRILEAMSEGPSKLVDIAHRASVEAKDLPKYLSVLQRLGYVRRIRPVTEAGGKRTLYELADGFFAFWFSFLYPFRSELELGSLGRAEERLRQQLDRFLGQQFERVAEEVLRSARLPLVPQRIGRWWGHQRVGGERREIEIDIVCLDERKHEALFAECKWSSLTASEARRILDRLREKARVVPWDRQREWICLIARKVAGKDALRAAGFLVFDLEDIKRLFRHASRSQAPARTGRAA